jgi:hypothetical protein
VVPAIYVLVARSRKALEAPLAEPVEPELEQVAA